MARIKRTSWSTEFTALAESKETDRNDCSIKAIAVATGAPYQDVLAIAAAFGRRRGKGTPFHISRKTLDLLGYDIYQWGGSDVRRLIDRYPGVHRNLHGITSHHPRRFAKAWREIVGDKVLVMASTHHMLCYRDGIIHDWSINRALRMTTIWTVTKKERQP